MSKKQNYNQNKKGGFGGKGKGGNDKDFLYREDAEEFQFMSFTFDDFSNSLHDNEDDPELLFVLKRVCAGYKHVLTLEFRHFWSTLKHNLLLRRSLNSFLSYFSRKRFNDYQRLGHEKIEKSENDNEVRLIMKEITRLVLTIFFRIVSCQEENLQKSNEFEAHKIILDEWLIDIPKMLDITSIYGETNPAIVKTLVARAFGVQKEFERDFDEIQEKLIKDFLDRFYKDLLALKKKDKLGSSASNVADQDIETKIELLTSILDTTESMLDMVTFFPKAEGERLILDEKISLLLENCFYELVFAREEAWVMGKYRGDIILLIDVVLDRILEYFKHLFQMMITTFSNSSLVKQANGKKLTAIWQKYSKELGKVQSFGKKLGENRYWYLVEYLSDRIDFQRLFEIAPADASEAAQMFQISVMSVIDERKRNVLAYAIKKADHEKNGEKEKEKSNENEMPDIQFIQLVSDEQKAKDEEENNAVREEILKKKKEEELRKEKEHEKWLEQEKNEVLTVYQKGAPKLSLKMSVEEEQSYIQKSMWLAMEYEDEPDDSYNPFQSAIPSGNKASDDEEMDEDDNEGQTTVEEGYDDGRRQNQPQQGYQGNRMQRDLNNNKPNTHTGRNSYKQNNRQPQQYQQQQTRAPQEQSNTNNGNNNNNNTGTQNQGQNQYQPKKQGDVERKTLNSSSQQFKPKDNNNNTGNNYQPRNNNNNNNNYNNQGNNNQGNSYNNNNNNNNRQQGGYNNSYQGPPRNDIRKKPFKNQEGMSGSDDDGDFKARKNEEKGGYKPQTGNNNFKEKRDNNNNNGNDGNAPPQKNILKKKYKD